MVSTDGRTDGQTDGRTDTEGYNIIPRHTLVAGYKKIKLEDLSFSTESVIGAASNLSRPAGSLSGLADFLM